jgi:sugar phosphate isomerase/epimerase
MQIGCQTILWGRKISNLEEVVKTIAQAGFSGIEFAQRPDLLGIGNDPKELKLLLEDYDLKLLGLAGGTLAERIKFARDVFPHVYLYIERWDPDDYEAIENAVEAQLRLALHPHLFKPTQNLDDIKKLLDEHSELYCIPDTAHLKIAGDDPRSIFSVIRDSQIAAIHLKDWTSEFGRSSHNYAKGFIELGRGIVGIDGFISTLTQHEYTGWLVMEQDSSQLPITLCIERNAEWLQSKGFLMPPKYRQRHTSRYRPPTPKLDGTLAPRQKSSFYPALLNASMKRPGLFFQELAKSLADLMQCRFATVWACPTAKDFLSLLAIYPDPTIDCLDRTPRVSETLTRDTIDGQKTMPFDLTNQENKALSSNREFFDNEGLTHMLSVPVLNPYNPNHTLYILNFFDNKAFQNTDDDDYYEIARNCAIASDKMLDDACASASGRVALIKEEAPTVSGFIKALHKLLTETFDCEGISIFLINSTGNRLIPQTEEMCELVWQSPNAAHHHYVLGEGITGTIWKTKQFFLTRSARQERNLGHVEKSYEKHKSIDKDECLFAPILTASNDVIGVVRCVNKRANPTRIASSMFSDDDCAVMESLLQAASPRLEALIRHERHLDALNQIVHSVDTPLFDITKAAKNVRNSPNPSADLLMLEAASLYLKGVLAYGEFLIRRDEGDLRAKEGWFNLLKDIIDPASERCMYLCLKANIPYRGIEIRDDDMPDVLGDKEMLIQVFFRLLCNAIIHRNRDRSFKVVVSTGGNTGSGKKVQVTHWGHGIGTELRDDVFRGIGLGLCSQIMKMHDCNILLKPILFPTTFELVFPASRTQWKHPF